MHDSHYETAVGTCYVGPLNPKHYKHAAEIEDQCYGEPWSEADFADELKRQNVHGLSAKIGERLVGYTVFEFHKRHISINNIAVIPDAQRSGVGRAMVFELQSRLKKVARNQIIGGVHEDLLLAHLFFRSIGFRCDSIVRTGSVNLYRFVYRQHRWSAENRIGHLFGKGIVE